MAATHAVLGAADEAAACQALQAILTCAARFAADSDAEGGGEEALAATALHVACARGWAGAARLLLGQLAAARAAGAGGAASRDGRGDTPLHVAARGAARAGGGAAAAQVVRALVSAPGAEVAARNKQGLTVAEVLEQQQQQAAASGGTVAADLDSLLALLRRHSAH